MRGRRRSRFTATMRDGSKHVVLAYSHINADSYFVARGFDVATVERGDYRMQQQPQRPTGSWRKNEAAIREAIEFLGITKPVHIRVTNRRGGRHGAHGLRGLNAQGRFFSRGVVQDFDRAADFGHYITIKGWLDPKRAGETIWHELCHAMQAESVIEALAAPVSPRQAYDAWMTCEAAGRGVTYRRKPIEVEAREYERFNDGMPLAC